jgi:hypothetical protein
MYYDANVIKSANQKIELCGSAADLILYHKIARLNAITWKY